MFLGHARGSLLELDTHLEIASQIGYLSADKHLELQEKLAEGRLLNGLLRSLSSNI
jgi:four helix bundle protein